MSVVSRRQARPSVLRRLGGVLRFAGMRLRGIPREAARGCLEVDSEAFMLDGGPTIPMALMPFVQNGGRRSRSRVRRRRAMLRGCAAIALLAAGAAVGWLPPF